MAAADLDSLYGETVTIINRLDAKDAALKQDVYYATVIGGCMWSDEFKNGTSSDGVVTPTTIHKVQVPSSAKNYAKYRDWRELQGRAGTFTLRTGDYVIRGAVEGEISASDIRSIVSRYEPDAFQVKAWRELTRVEGLPSNLDYRFALEG